jgi:hypothetical protein
VRFMLRPTSSPEKELPVTIIYEVGGLQGRFGRGDEKRN